MTQLKELDKKQVFCEQDKMDAFLKESPKKEKALHSVHLIADFEVTEFIEDEQEVETMLWEAAKAANNTPLKTMIHKFPGQGITGVVLLAESHIAIHTWPEHNYVAIDIFTCGKNTKPYDALEYLKTKICPKKSKVRLIKRG